MIEHFSKWLELVLLLNCNSERATYAFLNRIFSRFGVLIEVLINQGINFYGEFQYLCEKALTDHHTISRNHLKANELVERMVEMVKQGLWKYGLHKGHIRSWDLQLPWLANVPS